MSDRYRMDPEEALDAVLGATVDRVEEIEGSLVLYLSGDLTLYADAPTVYANGPQDTTDLDYLRSLWERSISKAQLTPEDSFDRGFYNGRFVEYVRQNAVPEEVAAAARAEASKRVYGNGPEEGLQC